MICHGFSAAPGCSVASGDVFCAAPCRGVRAIDSDCSGAGHGVVSGLFFGAAGSLWWVAGAAFLLERSPPHMRQSRIEFYWKNVVTDTCIINIDFCNF